jgi:hypothetical protein
MVRTLVRQFLRDNARNNRLIAGEESSNADIDLGILLALDDFNFATTPLLGPRNLANFPSIALLVLGASVWILKSAGILQTRNFLNFSSGGISAVFSDKTQAMQAWISLLQREYEAKKSEVKMFENVNSAYGSVATPYSGLAYYRGGYSPLLQEVFIGFRGFY